MLVFVEEGVLILLIENEMVLLAATALLNPLLIVIVVTLLTVDVEYDRELAMLVIPLQVREVDTNEMSEGSVTLMIPPDGIALASTRVKVKVADV